MPGWMFNFIIRLKDCSGSDDHGYGFYFLVKPQVPAYLHEKDGEGEYWVFNRFSD
jgi:hypothetical protein